MDKSDRRHAKLVHRRPENIGEINYKHKYMEKDIVFVE